MFSQALAIFIFSLLISFFSFLTKRSDGPRKSYDVALKTRKLLKGTLSDLINVLTRRLLSFYFVLPSKKIAFSFHNRFFFFYYKNWEIYSRTTLDCAECRFVGDVPHTHTAHSLSVPLCVNVREIHTTTTKKRITMDWCLWVCVCVWYEIIPFRNEGMQLRACCQPLCSHTTLAGVVA